MTRVTAAVANTLLLHDSDMPNVVLSHVTLMRHSRQS